MYLESLEIHNAGPIERMHLDCKFDDRGNPQPIILVGKNGAGKSIALSNIVNALADAQNLVFKDSDVEEGYTYKIRSSSYVRFGQEYSLIKIKFKGGYEVEEIQLTKAKSEFAEPAGGFGKWGDLPDNQTSLYLSNFQSKLVDAEKDLNTASHIYFPANRFEEPAWLNHTNLKAEAKYPNLPLIRGFSNRSLVQKTPMRELLDWVLDLIYDAQVAEAQAGHQGPANRTLNAIGDFLKGLFGKEGAVQWSIGRRSRRRLGFKIGGMVVTNNLFGLSSGESILLALFMTIIRDYDLSHSHLNVLSDIKGIVIVDELDLHLHTDMQHNLLPKLIRMFPKVQFIVTTHSPLFLLGMAKEFTQDGMQLFELPKGHEIEVERYTEFENAYKKLTDTKRYLDDVASKIEANQKPLVYMEGTTDIDYLRRAASFLGEEEILERVSLLDGDGAGNLTKIWKTYRGDLGSTLPQKIILFYDCDQRSIIDETRGQISRRIIPEFERSIRSGIENLFPNTAVMKAVNHSDEFFDHTSGHDFLTNGVETHVPEKYKIREAQKRNLCNWLCENGDVTDFENFSIIFDKLRLILEAD